MTKQLIVNANYNGLDVSFTGDGWFNATQAAKRFGKEPYMWLRQRETVEYISTLSEMNGNSVFVEDLNKISTIALPISLLASCQPSYAEVGKSLFGSNSDFLTELNKISYLPSKSEDSSQLEKISYLPSISEIFSLISNSDFVQELNKINQLPVFDSFNCIDKVAVTGNNLKQELRKLSVSVSHHTLVDVFLSLSFASCLFTGELRLALALVRLWRGGDGNKSFIGRIPSAVLLRFSNLLAALHLGQSSKKLPFEKVQ